MAYVYRLSLLSLALGCGPVVGESETGPGGSSTTASTSSNDDGPVPGSTSPVTTASPTTPTSGPTSAAVTTQPMTDPSATATFSTSVAETGGSSSAGFEECPGQPGSGALSGDACGANFDCASGVCLLANDVPLGDVAVCGGVPADCRTRFTGTVRDLVTRVPVAGEVAVLGALDALTNPLSAEPEAVGSASAAGAYDFVSDEPLNSPIAVVGFFVGNETYTTSGVAMASGDPDGVYFVGPDVHELWPVKTSDLEVWSEALVGQVAPELLPLGENGGIAGFVRSADGGRVEGALVGPAQDGSQAQVFYPRPDGAVVTTATDASGLFVIVGGAATGEDYTASASELTGSGMAFTTGSVVSTLAITVE